MDPRFLELATQFCKLVESSDLLEYLGAGADAQAEEAQRLLKDKRKQLQGMQANPKYRDVAKFLIKHYRAFDELLSDPVGYRQAVGSANEDEKLPVLEMALSGVLSDGIFSDEEEAFVRESALELGISEATYERIARAKCAEKGVALPARFGGSGVRSAPTLPSGVRTVAVSAATPVAREAREESAGWWDKAFTRLLLEFVPEGTRRVVDLAAGMGWAGLTLARERSQLEYLGLELDEARVRTATNMVTNMPERGRLVFLNASPDALPLPDEAVDVVLSVMSLQRFRDTGPVFAEAARVLRPGGRLVVVEGDAMSQQFWFDGSLLAYSGAFARLCAKVDTVMATKRPDVPEGQRTGLSMGPLLAQRMRTAGFSVARVAIHPVQTVEIEKVSKYVERLEHRLVRMARAASLNTSSPEVRAAVDALEALRASLPADHVGMGAHLVPTFVVAGVKT